MVKYYLLMDWLERWRGQVADISSKAAVCWELWLFCLGCCLDQNWPATGTHITILSRCYMPCLNLRAPDGHGLTVTRIAAGAGSWAVHRRDPTRLGRPRPGKMRERHPAPDPAALALVTVGNSGLSLSLSLGPEAHMILAWVPPRPRPGALISRSGAESQLSPRRQTHGTGIDSESESEGIVPVAGAAPSPAFSSFNSRCGPRSCFAFAVTVRHTYHHSDLGGLQVPTRAQWPRAAASRRGPRRNWE